MVDHDSNQEHDDKRRKVDKTPPSASAVFPYAKFFNNRRYSDIIITFSERRLYCHKFVICEESEYFDTLCGEAAKLKEHNEKTLELKEDDPDAVYGLIKFLYTGSYFDDDQARRHDWDFHHAVRVAANKYGLASLEALALSALGKRTRSLQDARDTLDVIRAVRSDGTNAAVVTFLDALEDTHRTALLQLDEYKDFMLEHAELLWRQYSILAVASEVEMDLVYCSCGSIKVFAKSEKQQINCRRCEKKCKSLSFRVKKQQQQDFKAIWATGGQKKPAAATVATAASTS